ncbi:MAG TPA: SCO family protein [Thermoanaerobaculia bacterium]|nr:SCO family protein [Thermoanaerobaculia bacterium]
MTRTALFLALSFCAAAAYPQEQDARRYAIADMPVVTQDGASVHFYRDLVQGRVVAMNFVFTSCTTVCPTMGATFARVQKLLGSRKDVSLISVSVDPANDTPERLAAWSRRLGGGPGWTLVTGRDPDITEVLKSLGVFTADPASHTPVVLVGNEATGTWERVDGLAAPKAIVAAIDRVAAQENGAGSYFANLKLTDQDGRRVDLYQDLMKGKVVVINSFFTSCPGSCPVMSKTFQRVQEQLGDRLGRDVFLISISVDPSTDTQATLKKYATQWKARPGWTFLTGSEEEVGAALKKLGLYVEDRETHQNLILVGNDRTGLWKKLFGLAKADEIATSVESVVNDRGAAE